MMPFTNKYPNRKAPLGYAWYAFLYWLRTEVAKASSSKRKRPQEVWGSCGVTIQDHFYLESTQNSYLAKWGPQSYLFCCVRGMGHVPLSFGYERSVGIHFPWDPVVPCQVIGDTERCRCQEGSSTSEKGSKHSFWLASIDEVMLGDHDSWQLESPSMIPRSTDWNICQNTSVENWLQNTICMSHHLRAPDPNQASAKLIYLHTPDPSPPDPSYLLHPSCLSPATGPIEGPHWADSDPSNPQLRLSNPFPLSFTTQSPSPPVTRSAQTTWQWVMAGPDGHSSHPK